MTDIASPSEVTDTSAEFVDVSDLDEQAARLITAMGPDLLDPDRSRGGELDEESVALWRDLDAAGFGMSNPLESEVRLRLATITPDLPMESPLRRDIGREGVDRPYEEPAIVIVGGFGSA